jgi:hypothetical protein
VLSAVLDGERPDGGVVGQAVAKKFHCIVQPCIALLLNHFRSLGDGLLHELARDLIRKSSISARNPVQRRAGDRAIRNQFPQAPCQVAHGTMVSLGSFTLGAGLDGLIDSLPSTSCMFRRFLPNGNARTRLHCLSKILAEMRELQTN